MKPREPIQNELEAHGLDPDGFHEDEDASPHTGSDGVDTSNGAGLHSGDTTGVIVPRVLASEAKSGVHRRAKSGKPVANEVPDPRAEWGARDTRGTFVLAMSVQEIGCFYIKPVSRHRWRVYNKYTTYEHVTYGTPEEIQEEYKRQSESWGRKFSGVKPNAWRNSAFMNIKRTGS